MSRLLLAKGTLSLKDLSSIISEEAIYVKQSVLNSIQKCSLEKDLTLLIILCNTVKVEKDESINIVNLVSKCSPNRFMDVLILSKNMRGAMGTGK